MHDQSNALTGGCHCGQIRYTLASPLTEMYLCHCRDCQIIGGSGFQGLGIIQRADIAIDKGPLACYTNKTESGFSMSRYFCGKCSSPVYIESSRFADISMVSVMSLDNPRMMSPSFEIWRRSRMLWVDSRENVRHYACGALDNVDE